MCSKYPQGGRPRKPRQADGRPLFLSLQDHGDSSLIVFRKDQRPLDLVTSVLPPVLNFSEGNRALFGKKSYLCSRNHINNEIMEAMDFKKYSDEEFKEALMATLNLKKEWIASVKQREKELGIQ